MNTHTRTDLAQQDDAIPWHLTNRADPRGAALADRHYSRKTPGAAQFTPLGRCVVLLTTGGNTLWVSSWPYAEYVKHAWRGAWLCSLFRNESQVLSSRLITQAVAATCWQPFLGMVTFVDTTQVRHKLDPGRCFRKAGWQADRFDQRGPCRLATPSARHADCPARQRHAVVPVWGRTCIAGRYETAKEAMRWYEVV